jgi:DnaJ-class molecular chaperone
MKRLPEKLPEERCPACDGRGAPAVKQPAVPGRKIYPGPCKKCGGKGRIRKIDD